MRLPWIEPDEPLPDPRHALRDPDGLLAAGHDLSPARLREAYRNGIFPWYSQGQPVLWWSPDPRMVLYLDRLRVSRSLAKAVRRMSTDPRVELTLDRAFGRVMRECAAPRHDQDGTWITDEIVAAYEGLHRTGEAHSVEVWFDGELAGGLYGVSLGRMFFGESMFARRSDASKVALVSLVGLLRESGFRVIDCQQATGHLASLGAEAITRERFLDELRPLAAAPAPLWRALQIDWPRV